MKSYCLLLVFVFCSAMLFAQDDKGNLGGKTYIVVKDYRPVLGESVKMADSPEGDTTSANPPEMDYSLRSKKISSEYELPTIKAVKIKDEQLAKLYRTYIDLGIGNYTTYHGDLYINALRSKKGAIGLALNHHSGDPNINDVGPARFSKNHGGVYGKYFFDHSTFTGSIDYNRDAVHYYGYDVDTIIEMDDNKQRFNKFGTELTFASNYLTKDHLDYSATFGFSSLNDLYEVSENDILIAGKVGKQVDSYYLNGDISLNYFSKSRAVDEDLSLNNDLKRSIVSFTPTIRFNNDKFNLVLGLNLSVEKNLDTDLHLFPKIDISLPIAEHILYVFAGVNGNIIKNSYQTIVAENPFVMPSIIPFNTINTLELKAGLNGNFTSRVSFMAMVKYSTLDNMLLYYNDSIHFNQFNAVYDDGKVLDLHAELSYRTSNKFTATLRFDQYGYTMETEERAWHKPTSEIALDARYDLWNKFILKASIISRGKYYARIYDPPGFTSASVKGFVDINLGIEYQYSKLLSIYLNLNNLGFSKYNLWYNYPSEGLNVLGGIRYSF